MNPFDDEEPTVGNGVRLTELESAHKPAPAVGKNEVTRIVPPPSSRPPQPRPVVPPPMPTTTDPSMPAVIIDTARPTTTEPSMPAIVLTNIDPSMPDVPIDASVKTSQYPSVLGVVPEEPFEYEKLSRKTAEFEAVHRTHPAAIAVTIVIVLAAVLLAVNWLTEPAPDGSPGDSAAERISKLLNW